MDLRVSVRLVLTDVRDFHLDGFVEADLLDDVADFQDSFYHCIVDFCEGIDAFLLFGFRFQ